MNHSIRIAVLILLAALVASCTPGGQGAATAANPIVSPAAPLNAEAALTQLEKDWVAAIVNKDIATIERVLGDDFVGATSDGQMYTKDEALADVKSGSHEFINLENISVRLFGNTAVVTSEQTEKSHHPEKDYSGKYVFTDVWVDRDGKWQAVASHGSQMK